MIFSDSFFGSIADRAELKGAPVDIRGVEETLKKYL